MSKELLSALLASQTTEELTKATVALEGHYSERARWEPLDGNPSNFGIVEVAADPGRALVERVTNAIDAQLEFEFRRRGGQGASTPRDAAAQWFGIPADGLSALSKSQREHISDGVVVRRRSINDSGKAVVEIIDTGVGLTPEEMPTTILGLNRGNKLSKFHLAGTYGQGGSATYAFSATTLVASRAYNAKAVGITVVKYIDLPADKFKRGYFGYLVIDDQVPLLDDDSFGQGTLVRHFDYNLAKYKGALGVGSLYGLLHQYLFDPVLPFWEEIETPGKAPRRRTIIGAKGRLDARVQNSPEDTAEDGATGLDHHMPRTFIQLGDYGQVSFELWVLRPKEGSKDRPTASFLNPDYPIVLTNNGQNQGELRYTFIRKRAELTYIAFRTIVHVDCDGLSGEAKRQLFASTREQVRNSDVLSMIERELLAFLKDDERLSELNDLAKKRKEEQEDTQQAERIKKEVGKLLKLQGLSPIIGEAQGAGESGVTKRSNSGERKARKPKPPIPNSEPPTFIRFDWDVTEPRKIYGGQTKWLGVETDAHSNYHDHADAKRSQMHFVFGEGLEQVGTTALKGGRMKVGVRAKQGLLPGSTIQVSVELRRENLPTLSDAKSITVTAPPQTSKPNSQIFVPDIRFEPVEGLEDERWQSLGWPEDSNAVCYEHDFSDGVLTVHYSKAFPAFKRGIKAAENKDADWAAIFETKYRIWLAAHALMLEDKQREVLSEDARDSVEGDAEEAWEREECCRVGTLASIVASRDLEKGLIEADDD